MRENRDQKKKRVLQIIRRLKKTYPDARCALDFSTPWELLVATILSAQCTDKRVNLVTPNLFRRFPRLEDYSEARLSDIENEIRSAGFYKNKAKSIQGAARAILERFDGKIPARLEDLVTLPGVGRKTANVLLGNAFGIPGLTVDTHMIRLNNRLGLTRFEDPVKIEFDLMPLVPQKDWSLYSHLIIHHGRARCGARRPDCAGCELRTFCPSAV